MNEKDFNKLQEAISLIFEVEQKWRKDYYNYAADTLFKARIEINNARSRGQKDREKILYDGLKENGYDVDNINLIGFVSEELSNEVYIELTDAMLNKDKDIIDRIMKKTDFPES